MNTLATVQSIYKSNPIALFSPDKITGLSVWLDASQTSSLYQNQSGTTGVTTTGQYVNYWADRRANGLYFVSNSNNTLTFATNFNTGYNTVNSSGTNYALNISNAALLPPNNNRSMFFILSSTASSNFFYTEAQGAGFSGSPAATQYYTNSGNKIYTGVQSTIVSENDGTSITGPVLLSTTQTTTTNSWLNGTSFVTQNSSSFSWSGNTPSNARLFCADIGSGPGFGSSGTDISAFIIYNSVLSTSDRQKVEGWLMWQYGMQASLPSGHPYQTTRP